VKQLDSNPAVMQEFVLALSKNARRSIAIKATAAEAAEIDQAGTARKVTRADTVKLTAAVAAADADGDGMVTRHEFSAWMAKQAAATATSGAAAVAGAVAKPTRAQLGLLGVNIMSQPTSHPPFARYYGSIPDRLRVQSAVPMIGFGFMDNFIMILAGDAIDASIGARFGKSRRFPV